MCHPEDLRIEKEAIAEEINDFPHFEVYKSLKVLSLLDRIDNLTFPVLVYPCIL